jgi:hypothetical protein
MPRNVRSGKKTGGRAFARGRGSATTKRSPRSYAELGRLGGEAVKRAKGRAYFSVIGRKGGRKGGEARKRQLMGG